MKNYEKIIGDAIRVEYSPNDDRVFVVFEILDPETKKDIKLNWTKDIEYRLVERKLVEDNEPIR